MSGETSGGTGGGASTASSGTPQYVLAVYLLARADEAPVATGAIAEAVDRSNAAATEMVQRLESRGLVTYEPYEGVALTDAGEEMGRELFGTYETLSRFFEDVLGLADHEREAMELAGAIDPVVADRLASTLLDDVNGETGEKDETGEPSHGSDAERP